MEIIRAIEALIALAPVLLLTWIALEVRAARRDFGATLEQLLRAAQLLRDEQVAAHLSTLAAEARTAQRRARAARERLDALAEGRDLADAAARCDIALIADETNAERDLRCLLDRLDRDPAGDAVEPERLIDPDRGARRLGRWR